jgi:outer membrane lipase/esterase
MVRGIATFALGLALAGASTAGQAAAASYTNMFTNMFVFGDSLSDSGNAYDLTGGRIPAPPYEGGRFSNGPVYAEYMADRLNRLNRLKLPLDNALSGGTNYAFGGAETSFGALPILNQSLLSVEGQVSLFRTQYAASGADPNALYILFAGANNLRRGIDAAAANPADASGIRQSVANEAVNDIIGMVGSLHEAGAQHFLVPNAPPLGAAPNDAAYAALANAFSTDFNTQLAAAVALLNDPKVILFDTYSLSQRVFADPLAFGFTNVSSPCLTNGAYTGGGTVCSEPDRHLIWDETAHLTTAGHELLADEMLSTLPGSPVSPPHPVPIPASIYLLGAAVAVLGAFSRKHGRDRS